jgi:hypothetical protein
MDPFETRLTALIDAHTAPAERPVDALAVARAAMAAAGTSRWSTGGIRFVGIDRRRAWLLAIVSLGVLAVLVAVGIGNRPTSREPTIDQLVYSDAKIGLVLEDPPGSTPKAIVPASGPGGEAPPCFPSDVLAVRSGCWSWGALSSSGRFVALHAEAASVTSILTLDGHEVAHFYDGQGGPARWSPVEDVMAINFGVELRIVDPNGQVTKRIPVPINIKSVQGWSPDGRHVVVQARDVPELWAVDVVSGESVRLTDTPTINEQESDWSPDGLIAYTADCGDSWTPDGPCPSSLWTVRPDGSDRRRLTPEDEYGPTWPTWAPDGKHLAYSGGTKADTAADVNYVVYMIDADGSNPRQITTFDSGFAGVLDWSPDGSTIVVSQVHQTRSTGEVETADTWIMGADGSNPRILVPGTIYVDQVWASGDNRSMSTASPRP